MKHGSKMTVTLSMVWIGVAGLLSNPKWLRDARDYITSVTHGTPVPTGAPINKGGGTGPSLTP